MNLRQNVSRQRSSIQAQPDATAGASVGDISLAWFRIATRPLDGVRSAQSHPARGDGSPNNRAPRAYQSYRVSVQTDNGGYRAFDVPSPGDLRIGDRVRIDNGQISRF